MMMKEMRLTVREETIKSTTLDVDAVQTGDTSDTKFGILTPTVSYLPLMVSKGLATREAKS
jgi:hypothetical protein